MPQRRLLKHKEGMADMRRNRKNNIRRERIIMIASSAFVLAALTMTGVYMKEQNAESKNDGYTLDFTALEENVDNKYQEIAQNVGVKDEKTTDISMGGSGSGLTDEQANLEDDLDYLPMEAGSHLVEIPGLTDKTSTLSGEDVKEDGLKDEEKNEAKEDENKDTENKNDDEEAGAENVIVTKDLHFAETDKLTRPVSGEILMHYSMDGSIYFATLDQYKYNPAVMFSAAEGSVVTACAEGKVVSVYDDAQIGHAVTLDLGDGYEATYGQLKDIEVKKGSYVNAGETIGSVAAPTKYFSMEGANLYFQLTKDGAAVNPETLFQ